MEYHFWCVELELCSVSDGGTIDIVNVHVIFYCLGKANGIDLFRSYRAAERRSGNSSNNKGNGSIKGNDTSVSSCADAEIMLRMM